VRRRHDLFLASGAAVLCGLIAVAVPIELIRIVAALPLALFLPGYAIVAVAFGSQLPATPMWQILSLGASLSVLALSGLLLTVVPGGIETLTWALLLVVIVLACCRGAALRRQPSTVAAGGFSVPRIAVRDCLLLGAAAVVAVAALVLAQTPLPASHATGFTALWMVPGEAAERTAEIGIQSSEQEGQDYVLRVRVGDGAPQVTRFALEPGGERTLRVAVPAPATGSARVSAGLYRADELSRPYRQVVAWLPRKEDLP
jgi:hypothetical protein